MSENYGVESIQLLSDTEHIRTRYGMYIGEASDPRQLFSEAFDNALDESQSGTSDKTIVHVDTENKFYSITDHGRGIPHGEIQLPDSTVSKEALEVVCTKSFSGAKFNNSAYRIRTGLHGVGLCCINSLSTVFNIESRRDGRSVRLITRQGVTESIEKFATNEPNGVTVSFSADPEIFETIEIPFDFILDRCRISVAFGYPVELYKDGELIDLQTESLADLLPKFDNVTSYGKFEIKSSIDTGEFIQVALDYTSDTASRTYGYTNLLINRYGGTHVRLIERSIEKVWSEFMGESEIELRWGDFRLGLNTLVAVFISDTEFSSQTKDKLTVANKNLEPLMTAFENDFRKALTENEELRKALLKRFAEYRMSQNKLLAQKEIMNLIKINDSIDTKVVRRKSVVPSLIECTSTKRDGTELILVEGESAGGTTARARDKRTQSVLPLQGKIKNVTWLSVKDALKSAEVRDIVNAIGAGVGEDCDPERSRYEKIIISTDADADGKHITALVLSVMVNLLPNMVKAGRVYVLEPPLYGWTENGEYKFSNEYSEIPEKLRESNKFTRYKGLGEMDDDEYKESCLIEGKRNLFRVDYPYDIDKFNEILGTSSGRNQLLKDLGIIKYKSTASEDLMDGDEDVSED